MYDGVQQCTHALVAGRRRESYRRHKAAFVLCRKTELRSYGMGGSCSKLRWDEIESRELFRKSNRWVRSS